MAECLPNNCACSICGLEPEADTSIMHVMNVFLILVLLVLMGLVLFSLVRGIIAFLKTTKIDLETGEGETVTDMQLAQNKAMFARIKYQALAIVVVAIILAVSR
jgi:Hypoxia induced protein conserved region